MTVFFLNTEGTAMPRDKSELGASMVEYALALGLLAAVFIFAFQLLYLSADDRAQSSVEAVKDMVPCEPGTVSGAECY